MAGQEVRAVLIIELLPHLDAGDRERWAGNQDERPLSGLGRRQAEAVAAELRTSPIDALYSSPALRCRESLGPLAARTGLPVTILPDLAEKSLGEDSAAMAERGRRAIEGIAAAWPEGRAVACSHGDIIPGTVRVLAAEHGIDAPVLERRGQWYSLRFSAAGVKIDLRSPRQRQGVTALVNGDDVCSIM